MFCCVATKKTDPTERRVTATGANRSWPLISSPLFVLLILVFVSVSRIGLAQAEALARNFLGGQLYYTGHPEAGMKDLRRALFIQRELGDRRGEATTLNSLGLNYSGLSQSEKAVACFSRALAILRDLKDQPEVAEVLNNLGIS